MWQSHKAKSKNYWETYRLWAGYQKGAGGVPKDPVKANRLLPQLVKGISIATFRPANGFAPKTPGEFIAKFNEHSDLRSEPTGIGGASFFRTKAKDGILIGAFLTEYPDKMRKAIVDNPSLELISIRKLTPKMFIQYDASPQESLAPGAGGNQLTRKPKIVSMTPPNGAKDVDPTTKELRVTFDVPMAEASPGLAAGHNSQRHRQSPIGPRTTRPACCRSI